MGFGVSKCMCTEVAKDKDSDGGSAEHEKKSRFGFSPYRKQSSPSMSKVERGESLIACVDHVLWEWVTKLLFMVYKYEPIVNSQILRHLGVNIPLTTNKGSSKFVPLAIFRR